jgi:hypothetical protein
LKKGANRTEHFRRRLFSQVPDSVDEAETGSRTHSSAEAAERMPEIGERDLYQRKNM